jgi:hypothetical protein
MNQFSSDYTESQVIFGNLNFGYTMLSNGMSINAGLNVTNSSTKAFSSFLIGPSAGISMEIIKKKLSGSATASYQISRTNSVSSGGVMNAAVGFSYRPHKKHSFNLNINMIHNSSDIVPDGTFTEFRFNAGYQFRLK